MGKENLTFVDTEIEKNNFDNKKTPVPLRGVDIYKVLVSKKNCFDEKSYKYFIGCLNNDFKVKTLHIMLPKTSVYVKNYDGQTKWMYFLIENDNTI